MRASKRRDPGHHSRSPKPPARHTFAKASWRLHAATFDVNDKLAGGTVADMNRENCEVARGLLRQQPGVTVRYWCEPCTYRK